MGIVAIPVVFYYCENIDKMIMLPGLKLTFGLTCDSSYKYSGVNSYRWVDNEA